MDYPFPGPRVLPIWEWMPLAVMSALAFMPLARVVLRRGPPRSVDVICGLGGALVAFIAVFCFPRTQAGLPHPAWHAVEMFALLVIVITLGWAFAAGLTPANTHKARLTEIGVPYGVAFGLLALMSLNVGLDHPREAARRMQCRNNMKQIGLAFHNYHDEYNRLPALAERSGQPARSWRVDILPYMDQAPLRNTYVDAAAWDSTKNLPIAMRHVLGLQCPSHPSGMRADGLRITGYAGIRGTNTAFPEGRGLTFRELTDGTSNTLLIVEACGRQIVWTEPRDIDLADQRVGVNLPGEQLGRSRGVISSYHVNRGGHVLFADGSVRFIAETIDPAVLKALATATGGETVGGY